MKEPLNANTSEEAVGYIIGGGLKENLHIRLMRPPQEIMEGSFVVVNSGNWRFYGIVVDLALRAVDERFAREPESARLPASLAALLDESTLYTDVEVLPALMQEVGPDPASEAYADWVEKGSRAEEPISIKTIPTHHAAASLASALDVAQIFGDERDTKNFVIGYTREQNHAVCLDLEKLVQRSAGIFGATGTGKSFLTRMLLAGLIRYDQASVLVFDMHNEYGIDDIASDTHEQVAGLQSRFGSSRVQVVSVGRESTFRGFTPDFHLELGYADILPEDISLLAGELNLKETTATTLSALESGFGNTGWFKAFKEMRPGATVEDEDGKKIAAPDSVAFWAEHAGVNVMAAESLHSKLGRLFQKSYIVESASGNPINDIIYALEKGKHVVLSFGKYESDLDYLLVSNLLTRRIRERWEKLTNESRAQSAPNPRPLVLVLEEAHKLLNRDMASQTTFSTIAREMRKYFVTLLVIDQRPSQIYDEVMSQLGTRISGWLGDDADIQAVLSGLAGREALRGMLSRLRPKEEVLMLGWGVPMPIPIKSRGYDDTFWHDILPEKKNFDQGGLIKNLYGD